MNDPSPFHPEGHSIDMRQKAMNPRVLRMVQLPFDALVGLVGLVGFSLSGFGNSPETAPVPTPPVTRTFYVSGVECGACVYLVQMAASECKGVLKAEVFQAADQFANITFDPRLVSEHQIAQAIREAMPVHGTPYLSRLRLRISGLSEHFAAVESLLQRWRDSVQYEVVDWAKGEVLLHFLPLLKAQRPDTVSGWNFKAFEAVFKSALPSQVSLEIAGEKTPN